MDNLKARTMAEANKITDQMIDDVLCSAFEGGSTYWCGEVKMNDKTKMTGKAEYLSSAVSLGAVLAVQDTEGGEGRWLYLDKAKITKGIEAAAVHAGETVAHWYDNHDGEQADCALQFALFDELVYG